MTSDEAQYKQAVREMESGDNAAKTTVALCKLTGRGTVIDADEAVVLLEERVKDRDNEAKWMLGLCCEYGMGTEQDIERAKVLYRESSEGGSEIGNVLSGNDENGRGCGFLRLTLGRSLLNLQNFIT